MYSTAPCTGNDFGSMVRVPSTFADNCMWFTRDTSKTEGHRHEESQEWKKLYYKNS